MGFIFMFGREGTHSWSKPVPIHFRFWLGGAGGENKLNESLGRSRFIPFGLLPTES